MKKNKPFGELFYRSLKKTLLIMRIAVILMILGILQARANDAYSQKTRLSLNFSDTELTKVLDKIEVESEFFFRFNEKLLDTDRKVNVSANDQLINVILDNLFAGTDVKYTIIDRKIILAPDYLTKETDVTTIMQQQVVTGKVTDVSTGDPMPGVNILVKGTTLGALTDANGKYTLPIPDPNNAILVFSFIGYRTQEISVAGKSIIDLTLEAELTSLDEVVVIGYGTMKKSDLTGSVVRIDQEVISERPNISLIQSLQGSSPGLNIGQVNTAGGEPSLDIRGRTSLSGEQAPLIVLDGVIFRGRLIDINPNDIKSIDILKDASSTAIYGSQASNGVIIITSKTGEGDRKPIINYSARYSFQEPTKRFIPEGPEEHLQRIEAASFFDSRTEESGYLEPNPNWDISTIFRTNQQLTAYNNNILTDWYDICTNDRVYTQNHNLSLTRSTENSGYFLSIGYTDQAGYMVNEDYSRWNARINVDNSITSWLKIGVQTFLTSSDYSGFDLNPNNIYLHHWYSPAYDMDGNYVESPHGVGVGQYNPLYLIESDDYDKRSNLLGNIYADFSIPFIKGLSFKTNYSISNYTTHQYYYRTYENNFLGRGNKTEGIRTEWSNDNILTYNNTFNDIHKVILTLVYGTEKRDFTSTTATATDFVSDELGYNRLQAGNSELQTASSDAWSESSLYNMARLFYSYRNKYLFTGTIRRDGFSGFSEKHKFGVFPSLSLAWVATEENFLDELLNIFDLFKIRASYGSNGNRTLNRYQTLARVGGGFNYINGSKVPVYTQSITDLESSDLKWETTTGINIGIDYSLFNHRVNGSIDYYSNNTRDILYNVDIPGISRFETFPDNLGKLHNHGIELSVSSVNVDNNNFNWTSQFVFSLNRNELKELLGFDNDGDGKEDDLVSEGLFIGESLSAIYTYYTDGELWQFGEDITPTADVGSLKIKDVNNDGVIDPDDRMIIGCSDPLFRFSIDNKFSYKNWMLSVFINSVQGNDKFYLGADDLMSGFNGANDHMWDNLAFPKGLDFWLPENTDARYQRLGIRVSSGLLARRYIPRSFIRLQDVNLSYNFSTEFLNKFQIQNLRLYFNGKNLFTLTKWPGWDPETGQKIQAGGRPVIRSYTFGIDVKF